jgi:hypothetical protein
MPSSWRQRLVAAAWRLPRGDTMVALLLPVAAMGVLGEAYVRSDLGDAAPCQDCAFGRTEEILTRAHVRTLEREGLVVIAGVLSPQRLASVQREVARMTTAFATSGNDADVRQDQVLWVQKEEAAVGKEQQPLGLQHCIQIIRGVGSVLERCNYRVASHLIVPQTCQLAHYPGNGTAGYRRHLDRCTATLAELGLLEYWRLSDFRGRVVTAILYLNDADRSPQDGGALRCWTGDNDDDDYVDVQPVGGTLIVFDANRVHHKVLPSHADRLAITCWITGVLQ